MDNQFLINQPVFDPATGRAQFFYQLGAHNFVETLQFPEDFNTTRAATPMFAQMLGLTAIVLGVSYFKLRAPLQICAPTIPLNARQRAFIIDIYENGLGEFYARNQLRRFGQLGLNAPDGGAPPAPPPDLPDRALLPIGGGKDSLVSVQLLQAAKLDFTPFAVNPKGPILSSIAKIGKAPIYVSRILDPEMIRLSTQPGYFNGHVPSTAINSMIGALCALLFGYNRIILSNERSASEGNIEFDGRQANHQHSKSLAFEQLLAEILAEVTGGALQYFSLLRPYSEARIAALFARQTRYDQVFSSCNRNFRLAGYEGELWCGQCPKCHFVFLIFAPVMDKQRLINILGQNLLADPAHEASFRELTGLAGQKPWECVGEILEAAACLYALTSSPEWRDDIIVATLKADLEAQYGLPQLTAALKALMLDSSQHHIPADLADRIVHHAV